MKIASGPKSYSFRILRFLFFFILCATIVMLIGSLLGIISKIKRASEWDEDTYGSQTYEQSLTVRDMRLVAIIAACGLAIGFINVVFGFLGVITLSMGALVMFALLDSLTLILCAVVIAYDEVPDLSSGWLVMNTIRLILAILLIRKVKAYTDEIIQRRVAEKEVTEHT